MFKLSLISFLLTFSAVAFSQGVLLAPEETDLERKSSNVDNLIKSNDSVSKCLDGGDKSVQEFKFTYNKDVKEGVYVGKTGYGDFLKITSKGGKELLASISHCPPRSQVWENSKYVLKDHPVKSIQLYGDLMLGERKCDFQNVIIANATITYEGIYIPRSLNFRKIDSTKKEKEAYTFFCPLEDERPLHEKMIKDGMAGDSTPQ